MIEAEDIFGNPNKTDTPSFSLLLLQSALLLALIVVVLLLLHTLRERPHPEAHKDQAYDPYAQSQIGLSRANDDFKMPSKTGNYSAAPRSPPETTFRGPQEGVAVSVPLNRSNSLPARRGYPSYGSPRVTARVPALDLPVKKSVHAQSVPVGLDLDSHPAWANLGTHSSMTSEEGSWTNSQPNTLPHLSPRQHGRMPGTASMPSSSPPPLGVSGISSSSPFRSFPVDQPDSLQQTLPSGISATSPIRSFAVDNPDSLQQTLPSGYSNSPLRSFPVSPESLAPMQNTPPMGITPPMAPLDSQTSNQGEEDRPVLLQWFPQQPSSAGSNRPPMRTRSLSPVPSSQQGSNRNVMNSSGVSPHFAVPPTPSFAPPASPSDDATSDVTPSMGPPTPPRGGNQPTLRPATNFQETQRSASQAGFERSVDGIVQWFNLATPRPDFVPSALTPLESASTSRPPRPPNVARLG